MPNTRRGCAASIRSPAAARCPTAGTSAAMTTNGPSVRQPKIAGDLPQAPVVERLGPQAASQSDNERRDASSSSCRLLLVAVSGHHGGADQFGEAADADLGVGRHGPGFNRTHGRQAPHASIDDDRHAHRRAHAHRAHPCGERPGDVLVAVHPRGPAGALHHRCEGVAVDRGSSAHGPLRQRAAGWSAAATLVISPLDLVAPQSGGVRGHTATHFLDHRVEHLRRFDPAGHQRGQSTQGRLLGGEPAILRVQRDIVRKTRRVARPQVRRRLGVRLPHRINRLVD